MHEVLTEHREEDVQLDELIDRLRAMLVQGLVVGEGGDARSSSASPLAGQRATSLALVFSELFGNALEHGGAHVSITLSGRDGDVVLAIADDGDGMQAAADGTGLSIVRALVRDELGGELDLRRRRWPACRGQVPDPPGKDDDANSDRRGRDDHPARPARVAREGGIRRVCGGDGRRGGGGARALSTEPDLALLDVKMPKLDGIEAARRILDERPIPIVMVTAYGEEELVSRAVEAGVFGYLVKPFRETDLLPAIATARARHEELAALREEADSLAEALAARKAIERAKGLLMEREGLTEQEAFARLRKASQISGRPLKVVADALVATLADVGGAAAAATWGRAPTGAAAARSTAVSRAGWRARRAASRRSVRRSAGSAG